jgi:hypothetical protein
MGAYNVRQEAIFLQGESNLRNFSTHLRVIRRKNLIDQYFKSLVAVFAINLYRSGFSPVNQITVFPEGRINVGGDADLRTAS